MITNKEIDEAASKSEDSFNCIDTFKGVNGLTVGQIYKRGFCDGAEWAQKKILESASEGFEDWMNESVESEMGRISSRRNTVTIEQELCNKFVWKAATIACEKKNQEKIERLKEDLRVTTKSLSAINRSLSDEEHVDSSWIRDEIQSSAAVRIETRVELNKLQKENEELRTSLMKTKKH